MYDGSNVVVNRYPHATKVSSDLKTRMTEPRNNQYVYRVNKGPGRVVALEALSAAGATGSFCVFPGALPALALPFEVDEDSMVSVRLCEVLYCERDKTHLWFNQSEETMVESEEREGERGDDDNDDGA